MLTYYVEAYMMTISYFVSYYELSVLVDDVEDGGNYLYIYIIYITYIISTTVLWTVGVIVSIQSARQFDRLLK